MTTRTTLALLAAALACLAGGCGWNKYSQTEINVQYSSDTLLHVAHLPANLPDGTPSDQARSNLMEAAAEYADSWTLMPARGAVSQEKGATPQTAEVYLLMAEGPRELGFVIWQALREEFGMQRPWLVSLPVQAMARVPMPEPEDANAAEEE